MKTNAINFTLDSGHIAHALTLHYEGDVKLIHPVVDVDERVKKILENFVVLKMPVCTEEKVRAYLARLATKADLLKDEHMAEIAYVNFLTAIDKEGLEFIDIMDIMEFTPNVDRGHANVFMSMVATHRACLSPVAVS